MKPTDRVLIAERAVTELQFAEVEVRISLPWNKQTVTTRQLIDDRKLDTLMHLVMPEHIRMTEGPQRAMMVREWQDKNQEARDFVNWFAKGLAFDLLHFLRKEINKKVG